MSSNDWEQRKFGEIVQKYEDPVETPTEGYMRLGIRSHAKGTFHSYVEKGKELETAKMFRVAANNFIVNITFGWEHAVAITDESDAGKLVSHRFPQYSFKEGMNPRFFKYLILDECFRHHLELSSPGGAGRNRVLKLNEMLEYKMKFPQMEEQEEIAIYFEQLDKLITLHQRKCEETKTLKKYMLQKMFPQNGHSVPEIRFSGFTEDWEQRKLNEIADKVSEKNKDNEFSEPFTNSAEQGIISQKDYFDREIVNNENLNGYYIVRNDDFIYNPRISVTAPVGPINRNRLGRNGVMSPLYTVFRTQDIDNLYLEFYFKTTKWHRFMKLNGDSGARFDRFTISSTQFMEMPIPYPTLEEQKKIGEYFDSLDNLITLHQRKYMKYADLSVFDWEQRKLGELAEIVGGGTPSTSVDSYWDGDIDWYAPAEIGEQIYLKSSQRKITEEGLNKSSAKILPVGTVLFTSRAGIGKTAILLKEGCTNQGFQSIVPNKDKLDSYFIFTRSEELKRYGETVGAGSTFVEVSGKQMVSMELMMPTTMDEQQKIGEYFSNLDHLITLHHRKQNYVLNTLIYAKTTLFITKTS